jgi:hypothetical protein
MKAQLVPHGISGFRAGSIYEPEPQRERPEHEGPALVRLSECLGLTMLAALQSKEIADAQ